LAFVGTSLARWWQSRVVIAALVAALLVALVLIILFASGAL
jgi:ABC-type microcin C transport system permease subunit YejB